jgi:hypothetical protein
MNEEKKFSVEEVKKMYVDLQKEFEGHSDRATERAQRQALKALLITHCMENKEAMAHEGIPPDFTVSALEAYGESVAYKRCAQRCKDMAQYTN